MKQWDATLDGDTRSTHRRLDGQIRETNEPFEMDGKEAMYPGDFGLAEEDCNCRCVALTRARAALDEDELKILRERAVRHSLYMDDPKEYRGEKLPQLKNYNSFKKNYLKAAETVENTGKSSIMDMDEKTAFNSLSDDLPERSSQVDQLLTRHSARETKWSGQTIVKQPNELPNAMGAKEWSCDITLRADSGIKTAVHEHLHARSGSYYPQAVYLQWKRAEEGAVELFAQEICKKNGVRYSESYVGIVKQLRIANSIMKEFDNEYDFAKAFYEVELPERYAWLRKRADKVIAEGKLSKKTVMSLNIAVNSLYGR